MKRAAALAAFLTMASAGSVHAQTALERGFDGALRGCEEWVLNPVSWTDGSAPFVQSVGLGDAMALVAQVDAATLPPPALREGNRYWRINSTLDAGYVLIVSDRLPMCHITGGGAQDLQPVVEGVLVSVSFAERWEKTVETVSGGMKITRFHNRNEPEFVIEISRAEAPGQRLDRVQVIATAMMVGL